MTEVSFGEWLKRQRMGRGLTREQLAHQIGCAVVTLRKIEAEERRPSAQMVERLADIFNIPANERKSFLPYARGDWQAAPSGFVENSPWLAPVRERTADDLSNPKIHLATFLFTDIESSAKLWEEAPDKMKVALQRHHEILQETINSNGGDVFQIVGDAFCAAFPIALPAVSAVVAAQRELYHEPWDLPFPIRVRMAIHTGEAEQTSDNPLLGGYASNQTLNRVARILSAAHGGQVLLSLATTDLVKDSLPADAELRDMGEHHLRNLVYPEHLFQLNITGLPLEFPPLNTLTHRHNLPVQMTSFIGREKEQAEVTDLLAKNRLVTLTGAGGIGKTRLSLEVGQKLLRDFSHGIWLVELAPILDPLLVPRTTAIAIGLRDEPQRPVIEMLCDYLHDKEVLIILDNCEHIIDACVSLADKLLHAAPNVRILASSREALGISGEVNYRVPSLGLPDVEYLPPTESLSQYEAVTLFIERAKSAVPSFFATNENASALTQICSRLDGIPLAIELAAAKVHVLSVEQIAKRLNDRFRLLTSGNRLAFERHQTLRAVIDWSYNLLSPSEQILFRRLSVFVGGWTLESAESVCADKSMSNDDVLDLLEQLINKSLVIAEESEHKSRYRMLETVRQYANDKLIEVGESDTLRDKHLEYFLDLAEAAEPHLRKTEQIKWLKQLDSEHDNLRTALAWALVRPSAESILRLAGALGDFWILRVYLLEGANWLDQALDKTWNENSKAEKTARAKALYRRADIAEILDEVDINKTSAEAALALCEEVGDLWGVAYSRLRVAISVGFANPPATIKATMESLNDFQSLGDAWGEAVTLGWLAMLVSFRTGTREEFLEIEQRFMSRARAAGDRERLAFFLEGILFNYLLEQGDWDEAERILQEAEQLYAEIDSPWGINNVRTGRTGILIARGDFKKAKMEAKLAIDYLDRVGEKNWQSHILYTLALIEEAENDLYGAVAHAEKALALAKETGTGEMIALGLTLVGIFKYKQGNIEYAMKYLREGLQFMQKHEINEKVAADIFVYLTGILVKKKPQTAVQILAFVDSIVPSSALGKNPILNKPYFERFLSVARAKLSEEEFASSWDAGSKMTPQETVDLVLKTLEEM